MFAAACVPHSAPKHRCEERARLAVVDRADSAQRVLAAAGSPTDPGSGERLHPIAVSTVSRTRVTALAGRARPEGRERPSGGGVGRRLSGGRAQGQSRQDRGGGALAEPARRRRRAQRHPHHRARPVSLVGGPHHPGVDALPARRRCARAGRSAHPRADPRGYSPGVTSGLATQLCTGVATATSVAPGRTVGGSRSSWAATVSR